MMQENDDQIKKLKDLINVDSADSPEIEVFVSDDGDANNKLNIRTFSSDEFESEEYQSFVLSNNWNLLIEDVNCNGDFGEEQKESFTHLIEMTFKFLLPTAQGDSLPKDAVEVILLMQEFELQPAFLVDDQAGLEAAQALTEALRTQAVSGWGEIDGAISDRYLQVRKQYLPEGSEDDDREALYIVDMEDVDLPELIQQFRHPEDYDTELRG